MAEQRPSVTEKAHAFIQSIQTGSEPDSSWPLALRALWWTGKGDWDKAHSLVARATSQAESWVHAHLHRVEGDQANAAYWYKTAGKAACELSFDEEFETLVEALVDL